MSASGQGSFQHGASWRLDPWRSSTLQSRPRERDFGLGTTVPLAVSSSSSSSLPHLLLYHTTTTHLARKEIPNTSCKIEEATVCSPWTNALCCPKENKRSIKASLCSPLSLWWMLRTMRTLHFPQGDGSQEIVRTNGQALHPPPYEALPASRLVSRTLMSSLDVTLALGCSPRPCNFMHESALATCYMLLTRWLCWQGWREPCLSLSLRLEQTRLSDAVVIQLSPHATQNTRT